MENKENVEENAWKTSGKQENGQKTRKTQTALLMVKLCKTMTPDNIRKTDGKQKHGFGKRQENRWKTDRKYGKQRKRRGKRLENKENIEQFING